MPSDAANAQPWVDVVVRFRGRVLGTRRLGGRAPDVGTPLKVGALAVVLGLTLAILDLMTGYGSLVTVFEPVILGGGLVGLGLVGVVVGVMRRGEADPRAFWMGPASNVDVVLERPGIPDRLAVARIVGQDIEVRPPPGFEALYDGRPVPFHDTLRFGPRSHLVLRDDDVEIDLRRSAAVARTPRSLRPDARTIGGMFVAALAIGGTIMVAHYVVPDPLSIVVPTQHTAHGVTHEPAAVSTSPQ